VNSDRCVDVQALCRGVKPLLLDRSIGTGSARLRVEPTAQSGGCVNELPLLPIACFVDGIQVVRLLTMRADRRPVYLATVAAGAIDPHADRVVDAGFRLVVLCSHRDEVWARSLPGGCDVEVVDANHDAEIDLDVRAWVDRTRRDLEQQVLNRALSLAKDQWIVLDGSLRDVARDGASGDAPQVIGVVKTCEEQYLTDEHLSVHTLAEAHTSRAFVLPAARRGQCDRISCYLRQYDATHQPWTFGLVRIELPVEHSEQLTRAAATVLAGRQHRGVGDARWDRQQQWIARLETALHAHVPYPLRAAA